MESNINIDCKYVVIYSELFSKLAYSENSIAEKISKININQTFNILLKISSIIDSYLRSDPDGIQEYKRLKMQFREVLFYKGANLEYYDNGLLACPQGIMMTFKWIFAYGNENSDDKVNPTISYLDIYNVLSLIIAIADFLPKDEVENNKIEFCNAAQYFGSQKVIKYELARSYNIFVLNQVKLPDYISVVFLNKYGISIEEYLANSFGFLNYAFLHDNFWNQSPGNPIKNFDAKLLKDSYNKYIQMMSLDFHNSRKKAKSTLHSKWDFNWLLQYPLLIVGEYACPYNYITFSYVWFEGLYWRIRFCFPYEDRKFLNDFGKPFENYIQSTCRESVSLKKQYIFIEEHEYQISKGNNPRSSDGYILKDENLLIIECKAKAPVADTISGYNLEAINKEVIDLLVLPVHQVDKRYIEMMQYDQDFIDLTKNVKNIYIIVVSLEKIQPIPYTYSYANSFLRESEKTIEVDGKIEESEIKADKVRAYFNFNAYELEKICALIENGIDIFNELDQYRMQPIYPFENYLISRGYQELKSSVVENNVEKGCNDIFKRTFGEPLSR